MICPYCEQGVVQEAKMKKSGKRIFICEECDTVWEREVNFQIGVGFETYMNSKGYEDMIISLKMKEQENGLY